MDLNNYPSSELRNLQLAVALAYEQAKKEDTVMLATSLIRWANDIDAAIKDAEFEEQTMLGQTVNVANKLPSDL